MLRCVPRLSPSPRCKVTIINQWPLGTITIAECVETLERIKRIVGADLLKLPGTLCHDLANLEPRRIQQLLDTAFRSALERLNRPENYLYSNL